MYGKCAGEQSENCLISCKCKFNRDVIIKVLHGYTFGEYNAEEESEQKFK